MQPDKPTPTNLFVPHAVYVRKDKHYAPVLHRDLPMCDAELGRPKLEMLKCYHLGCEQTFTNGAALSNHLSYNMAYHRGFVKKHQEQYPAGKELKDSKCSACSIDFKDVGQLAAHLARLGLPGYWKKGQTYRSHLEELRKSGLSEHEQLHGTKPVQDPNFQLQCKTFPNVFETELCLVCEQLQPVVLYEGCKHLNVCYRCFKLLQARETCIYCKTSSAQLFRVSQDFLDKIKT